MRFMLAPASFINRHKLHHHSNKNLTYLNLLIYLIVQAENLPGFGRVFIIKKIKEGNPILSLLQDGLLEGLFVEVVGDTASVWRIIWEANSCIEF